MSVTQSTIAGAARGKQGRWHWLTLIRLWRRRSRERRELAALSSQLLHDIGVTHYEAVCGARKPFWRC